MAGQLDLFGNCDGTESGEEVAIAAYVPPKIMVEHLQGAGLTFGRIRLAAELASLEPELSVRQRRAFFAITLLGLEAQGQGSTFVPLGDGDGYVRRRLEELVPRKLADDDKRWQPQQLVEDVRALVERRDLDLIGGESDWKPLIVSKGRLYHQRMMLHETRLVEAVKARLGRSNLERGEEELIAALDEVRKGQPPGRGGEAMTLNPEQEYALLTALHRRLTLITGGPGTGKTSIVVSLLRILVRLGVAPGSVALAAPTGKAANRMAESIYGQLRALDEPAPPDLELLQGLEAPRTLHRLMGYSPRRDRFAHHGANPLPHRMVIVDEASMIDLFLMERLFAAVSPMAQLVLLGDADQLPSVDTGAVLRDLVPEVTSTDAPWRGLLREKLEKRSGVSPTSDAAVRLEKSYRMRAEDPAGRQILVLAQSIRDYDQGPLAPAEPISELTQLASDFEGVHLWEPPSEERGVEDFVDWWFARVLLESSPSKWVGRFNAVYECDEGGQLTENARKKVRRLLKHHSRAQILTLTRVFSRGSEELNRRFHRKMASFGRGGMREDYRFYPGEPVMMLRNDYERDLFNGDHGVVVWCRRRGRTSETPVPTVVFDRSDGVVAHSLGELGDDLEQAFAMTVHKAQGSEFERVALVLPTEPIALLNRELLYTGLTRASRGVLVAGAHKLLEFGAANSTERFSAVREKLRG